MTKKPGFMLFDLLLFVALAGIFYLSISKMIPKKPVGQNIDDFFIGLNDLSSLATQEARFRQLPARLEFKQSKKTDNLKLKALIMESVDEQGGPVFKDIENGFVKNSITLPKSINLMRWWTDTGHGELSEQKFNINISRDGIMQPTILHLRTVINDEQIDLSAVSEPFIGIFKKESGFKEIPKPESNQDVENQ